MLSPVETLNILSEEKYPGTEIKVRMPYILKMKFEIRNGMIKLQRIILEVSS